MDVFTIGHSNHSLDTFLDLLTARQITHLVDVRSSPKSRFCPHFNVPSLRPALQSRGIAHILKGSTLGGFSDPDLPMAQSLAGFATWCGNNPTARPAMMCAEKKPEDCHRYNWLANWLHRCTRLQITNIMPDGKDWRVGSKALPALPDTLPAYRWRIADKPGVPLPARLTGFFSREMAEKACLIYQVSPTLVEMHE